MALKKKPVTGMNMQVFLAFQRVVHNKGGKIWH